MLKLILYYLLVNLVIFAFGQACTGEGHYECSGDGFKICRRDATGGLSFTDVISCGSSDLTCVTVNDSIACTYKSSFNPPSKPDECNAGQKRCVDGGIQSCFYDNLAKQYFWTGTQECPRGQTCLGNGYCAVLPPNSQCSGPYKQCYNATFYRYCVPNFSDVTHWSEPIQCHNNDACINNQCAGDECEIFRAYDRHGLPEGDVPQTQCLTSSTYRQCVYDATLGHNVWGSASNNCPAERSTCNNGGCVSVTYQVGDRCPIFAQSVCISETSYGYCRKNIGGLQSFWAVSTCPSGSKCLNAMCVSSGNNSGGCSIGQQRCLDSSVFQTCINGAQEQPIFGAEQNCAPGTKCESVGDKQIQCI